MTLPDKRGSEQSGGDWRTSSYEDLATDTVAALDYMRQQDRFEISQLGIIGMSQGGQYAPLVSHLSGDTDFMIDVVGTSLPSYDVLHYEETKNLESMGFLPGVARAIAYPANWILIQIGQRDFWDAVGNFDAIDYWQTLDVPALVLYGSADTNVPAEASKARLDQLNNPHISVRIYEGSGHALEDPPGLGDQIFRDDALVDILNFIHVQTR